MGGGESHSDSRIERHVVTADRRVPGEPDLVAQIRARRCPLRLCSGELGLGEGAVGERARRELRRLAGRDGDRLVERATGDAEPGGGDAERQQREVREAGDRFVDVRRGRPRPRVVNGSGTIDRRPRSRANPCRATRRCARCRGRPHRPAGRSRPAAYRRRSAHPPRSRSQCCVPLPHCQRPVTAMRSPVTTPRPLGANTPPVGVRRVRIDGARHVGGEEGRHRRRGRGDRGTPPGSTVARATSTTASIRSTGETPGPPYARGRHNVSSPAPASASTVAPGRRRSRSASSAPEAAMSATRRARSTTSTVELMW